MHFPLPAPVSFIFVNSSSPVPTQHESTNSQTHTIVTRRHTHKSQNTHVEGHICTQCTCICSYTSSSKAAVAAFATSSGKAAPSAEHSAPTVAPAVVSAVSNSAKPGDSPLVLPLFDVGSSKKSTVKTPWVDKASGQTMN